MNRALIAAIVAAGIAVAGCAGSSAHPAAAATTAGSHASPGTDQTTAASAISTAFRKGCSGFDAAYTKIQSATQGETTVGQLMATLTGGVGNTADDWSKQLSTAAKAAGMPGVPEGGNKARALGVKIDAVALALDQLQLEADYNKPRKITAAWSEALNEISAVRAAGCS